MLSVKDISLRFRGLDVLRNISFDIVPGEILGLIGPNGAGKTSLFNCLTGIYKPSKGNVIFGQTKLEKLSPHEISRLGIGRTFQNLALFEHLTVLENVLLGSQRMFRRGFSQCLFSLPWIEREENFHRMNAVNIISMLNLDLSANKVISGLSYGTLKRVELARGLALSPKILLLDEPAGGLSQSEVHELSDHLIRFKNHLGLTQVLVEHNIELVMSVCDRIIVFNAGAKIAEGTPVEIQRNEAVIRAYLGGGVDDADTST